MNKLILVPLTAIIMLALLSMTYSNTGGTFSGQYSSQAVNATLEGSNVTAPNVGMPAFNLSGIDMALIILVSALAIGGIAGIRILGTGVSDLSQKLIIISIIYLGLWAVFSILANNLILTMGIFGGVIWLILTIIYLLGVSSNITGSGDG